MKGRTIQWFADGDEVIIRERTKSPDNHWYKQRVLLTRKEIVKLAKEFPVQPIPSAIVRCICGGGFGLNLSCPVHGPKAR